MTDETAPLVAVVDDDEAVRLSTERLIRHAGYRVDTYEAGEPFLAAAATRHYACVLLDVRMPQMDGLSVLRAARARGLPLGPVIVLTGHGDVPLAVEAMKLGADAFLEKPYNPGHLSSAIRRAIEAPRAG